MKATKEEWEELEIRAAAGLGGVLHENFRPSVLMMDENTDNSFTPVCVVNGECAVQYMYVWKCTRDACLWTFVTVKYAACSFVLCSSF